MFPQALFAAGARPIGHRKRFFYLNLLDVDFSHLGRQWKYWKVNPRIGKLSNGRHDYYPDQLHSILHLENVIECQRREIEQLKHGYQFDLFGDSPPSSEE